MAPADAPDRPSISKNPEHALPLVSVVIPTFNAERFVERALTSVASQTLKSTETIVIDDASKDRTTAVVRTWQSRGVRLLAQAVNRGPAAARNIGIRAATGMYVAFLDADDEWMPEKLERQVAVLTKNPAASFCGCNAVWRFPDGSVESSVSAQHPVVEGSEAWRVLLRYSFVQTPSVVARREILLRANGFDESLAVGEDQDLWLRLAMMGPVVWAHESLVTVHKLADGYMASNAAREYECLLPMIERHVAARRNDLSSAERRAILGTRFSQIGRNLYGAGMLGPGGKLIVQAITMGFRPGMHLAFLLHASPIGQWLKARLRRAHGPARL